MNPAELLAPRLYQLRHVVNASFAQASPESQGFALRLGVGRLVRGLGSSIDVPEGFSIRPDGIRYGGYCELAYLGFALGADCPGGQTEEAVSGFFNALKTLQESARHRQSEFASNDVAVLGVADGLNVLRRAHYLDLGEARQWLLDVVSGKRDNPSWSSRLSALAREMLDPRGRLRTTVSDESVNALALEVVLPRTWPAPFHLTPGIVPTKAVELLKNLLIEELPESGDLDRAAVWLLALDTSTQIAAASLVPSVSATARLLSLTQTAFQRWVWEDEARRGAAEPARWLIDNEHHVQAFLWAVLYPIFGEELRAEEYLLGSSQQQPRIDFGIRSLRLIIEAKVVRTNDEYKKIEEEIAGDLGLYFKDTSRYDRMIVYVYDDADPSRPENYQMFKDALRERDTRIEDVIIVRRPSVIPPRKERRKARSPLAIP